MTAGSIAVPTIIPLRAPITGKLKNFIDTHTPIELRTETSNAEIFFTIDGSKPNPFAALGTERSTIKYTKPFKLREGKKSVKAIAISRWNIKFDMSHYLKSFALSLFLIK